MNPPDVSSLPRLPTEAELVTIIETALGVPFCEMARRSGRERRVRVVTARTCLIVALVYVRGASRTEAARFLGFVEGSGGHTATRRYAQADESDPLGRAWGKVWREIGRVVDRS
jgi:hypothetical protein